MDARQALSKKIVDYIGTTAAGLEKAAQMYRHWEEKQARVRELIPAVVNALVEGEHVDESEREKAAEMLHDHATTLELLATVATRESAGHRIGRPVRNGSQKAASAADQREIEATIRMFEDLGLPAPRFETV